MKRRPKRGITVSDFFERTAESLSLKLIAGRGGMQRIIRESTVNRPGLALAGFDDYFAWKRVQAMGKAEISYLRKCPAEERRERLRLLFRWKIPCVVLARQFRPFPEILELAEELRVPIFQTPMITMKFINAATLFLESEMAPSTLVQAGMVDIQGIGVLIQGRSGVGKTECALSLLRRGYSLVADDVTRVRLVEGRELVGTSPETTRYHMEVRGLGIVDVAALFGISSIRQEKRVDLAVTLVDQTKEGPEIDRIGLERSTVRILGISVPHVLLLVRPGRETAHLVEVAALNEKLRSLGWNAAELFNRKLIEAMGALAD